MNAIFGDQFYQQYILKISQNLSWRWVLRICFSQFFQDTFYAWITHLGASVVELIKQQCYQAITGTLNLAVISFV